MNDGLIVFKDNKQAFTSSEDHLLIDLNAKVKRFDIVTLQTTALSLIGAGTTSEILTTIPHGLTYVPYVDAYFWAASDSAGRADSFFQLNGAYYKYVFSLINLGGPQTDAITIAVNGHDIVVTHTLSDPVGLGITSVPTAIKMKYLIFSNPGQLQL